MSNIEWSEYRNQTLVDHRLRAVESLYKHFPGEIYDPYHGLDNAAELIASGKGLIFASNHFSLGDGLRVFLYAAAQRKEFLNKPWLAPAARHIYEFAWLANKYYKTGIDIYPLYTESALSNWRFRWGKHSPLEGLRDYKRGAIKVLRSGGLVGIFPQRTRKAIFSELGEHDIAIKLLTGVDPQNQDDFFGIVPMALSVPGATEYSEFSGLNIGVRIDVTIGPLWMKNDFLSAAKAAGRTPDGFMMDQIGLLLPEAYPRST